MPSIHNLFEDSVETILIKLIQKNICDLDPQFDKIQIRRGESDQFETLPEIVVSSTSLEEIVFQSGNYKLTVELTVKTDLDSSTPEKSKNLFGAVVDVCQYSDLKSLMNDYGTCEIKLIVVGVQRVNEIGNRLWSKTITMEFFGYAVTQTEDVTAVA